VIPRVQPLGWLPLHQSINFTDERDHSVHNPTCVAQLVNCCSKTAHKGFELFPIPHLFDSSNISETTAG
jgi:hypothetical protein